MLYPVVTQNIEAVVATLTIDRENLVEVPTYPALNCLDYVSVVFKKVNTLSSL